jgi:hypothetical protein
MSDDFDVITGPPAAPKTEPAKSAPPLEPDSRRGGDPDKLAAVPKEPAT